MSERNEREMEDRLSYFWNELVRSAGEPVTEERKLDPAIADALIRFQALGSETPPQAARDRLRQRVFDSIDKKFQEETMTTYQVALPIGATNGRVSPSSGVLTLPGARVTWQWLAAALLLIVAASAILAVAFQDRLFDDTGAPAVIPAVQETPPGDWTQYRNGPGHTGVTDSPGPEANPTTLWEFDTGGPVNSEAAVVGGVVYIGSGSGHLYALDAASGDEIWAAEMRDLAAVDVGPVVGEGLVYVANRNNELVALNRRDGSEEWAFPTANGDASPVLIDGSLFVSGSDGIIYALDPSSGDEQWSFATNGETARTPAYADGKVFAGTMEGRLVALDAATGEQIWVFETAPGLMVTTVVSSGTVYQSVWESDTSGLFAIDAETGSELWRFQSPDKTNVGIPTIGSDHVFVAADDGKLYALDIATGDPFWIANGAAPWQADVKLAGDVLYIFNPVSQTLHAFDASDGSTIWQLEEHAFAGKGPAISNGVLYAATDLGVVFAIGSGTEEAGASSGSVIATPDDIAASSGFDQSQIELIWETAGPEASPLELPQDIGIAPDGSIYVLNPRADQFHVYAPDGSFVETWGGPGNGPGEFSFYGANLWFGAIDLDADGNIYVFDLHNHRIQKFAPDRTFLKEWGVHGTGVGEFIEPEGAIDATNELVYVTDSNNRVQVFDLDGNYLDRWGRTGREPGQFNGPRGVAIDSGGNIYVVEQDGRRIQKFDWSGAVIDTSNADFAPRGQFGRLFYVTVDENDYLYLPDWEGHRILIYNPDGELIAEIDEIPGFGRVISPVDIEFDDEGFAYITLEDLHRLVKVKLPPLA